MLVAILLSRMLIIYYLKKVYLIDHYLLGVASSGTQSYLLGVAPSGTQSYL